MTKLISSFLGIAFSFIADHFLIKWVGHARLWYYKHDNKKLKASIDEEYLALQKDWDKLKDKRHNIRRG